jgi:hypothetical protein
MTEMCPGRACCEIGVPLKAAFALEGIEIHT